MQKIRSIEEDIKAAQEFVLESRIHTKLIKEQLSKSIARLLKLKRREERLNRIKHTASKIKQICNEKYRCIIENTKQGNFSKSYGNWVQLEKQMASSDPQELNSLVVMNQLQNKLHVQIPLKLYREWKLK